MSLPLPRVLHALVPRVSLPGRPSAIARYVLGGVLVFLGVAGVGLAAYLAYENVRGESGVCTGLAHGCAAVQQSRYGKLFGVPVSVPGLGLYAVLSLAAIAWASNWRGLRPLAAVAGFYGALFGVVFSAYLTWIEAFVLDAWCVYCVASALLVVVLCLFWSAALAIEVRSARLRRSGAAVPRPDLRPLPPSVRPGRRR